MRKTHSLDAFGIDKHKAVGRAKQLEKRADFESKGERGKRA